MQGALLAAKRQPAASAPRKSRPPCNVACTQGQGIWLPCRGEQARASTHQGCTRSLGMTKPCKGAERGQTTGCKAWQP